MLLGTCADFTYIVYPNDYILMIVNEERNMNIVYARTVEDVYV